MNIWYLSVTFCCQYDITMMSQRCHSVNPLSVRLLARRIATAREGDADTPRVSLIGAVSAAGFEFKDLRSAARMIVGNEPPSSGSGGG